MQCQRLTMEVAAGEDLVLFRGRWSDYRSPALISTYNTFAAYWIASREAPWTCGMQRNE